MPGNVRTARPTKFWSTIATLGATVLLIVGGFLAVGGAWLAAIGGSLYYLLAGIAYLVTAYLLWRLRPGAGWLAGAVLIATMAWSVVETGLDFWPLFARLMLPAGLAAAALFVGANLRPHRTERRRIMMIVCGGVSTAFVIGMFGLSFVRHGTIEVGNDAGYIALKGDNRPSDWTSYGRTVAGTRFSPFDQINRDTVGRLEKAWVFHTGDMGPGVDQNTPTSIGDTVYSCSRNNIVTALDGDSGKVRWRFDPHAKSPMWQRCRGLGVFRTGETGKLCSTRLLLATIDARLIALDARTGQRCSAFGDDGVVQLKVGMGPVAPGYYFNTSAPLVARDKIVIGGWVVDNQSRGEPSGVVRAFDARTGALSWAWDLGNPATTKLPPAGQTYTRGTPNMWTTASADDQLGLVYLPLGNETPDYYAPGRNPRSGGYNSALVALDVETGRERWHYQTTHHDIWDYDLPSQPALVDAPDGHGGMLPAVMQTTKRGQIFLLDRRTGRPLADVREKAVPQVGAVPEERLSATQPYSVGMPVIGAEQLTEGRMWGMTMLDQLACRIAFRSLRYDGDFTPPGLKPSLQMPANLGGMNWGSVSVDPVNHYAYVNDVRMANVLQLVPRAEFAKAAATAGGDPASGHGPSPQKGTPYGILIKPFLSKLGVPCTRPPYGTLTAIDLKTRKIAWQVPAGTARNLGPLGIPSHMPMPIGMPTYAGTSLTAGGLLFFAGFQDFDFRAYDARTGLMLWQRPIPVGASATPMSFVSPKTGRQYIILSAGGAAGSKKTGDYVIAYALRGH